LDVVRRGSLTALTDWLTDARVTLDVVTELDLVTSDPVTAVDVVVSMATADDVLTTGARVVGDL